MYTVWFSQGTFSPTKSWKKELDNSGLVGTILMDPSNV